VPRDRTFEIESWCSAHVDGATWSNISHSSSGSGGESRSILSLPHSSRSTISHSLCHAALAHGCVVDQHVLEQLKQPRVAILNASHVQLALSAGRSRRVWRTSYRMMSSVARPAAQCLPPLFTSSATSTRSVRAWESGASSMDTMAMWLGSSFEALGAALVSKMQGWPAGSNCSTLATLPGVAPGAATRNSKRSEAGSAISSMP